MAVQTDRVAARVVSLAPSATETLRALGATDRLVGATYHCETEVPAVGGWLNPDYDAVADRDPDLVLTADDLQADVTADLRDRGYDVFHAAPTTLSEVVESLADLGAAVGLPDEGEALAERARTRLDRVRRRVPDEGDGSDARPVVYCEEWSEPPMVAGNWVPEVVEVAGGRYPFLDPGERSREVSATEVETADPDHVVIHVCGHGACADPETVTDRDWDLSAIARDDVHVVDDSLLNQPSPRLVEGVERLAALLHPDAFDA
ncbi:helical backbone metal receptor [Halorussus gelatinilyticus]|uniref:Helical backbone metal receptor n=1 Tax=Halorussus gelatinilyticus TaxID=2937524 RepID=A0A8U0IDD3_9EURY|nr:helical backbone metal receptor [Halorussus gelatinilyticus]UPV99069.1 helical backbone metal receptor [Halorussus gelatinilyticus]